MERKWDWLPGACLAMIYFAWCWWYCDTAYPFDPDAARHALNGAAIYDTFRTGGWIHPVAFFTRYYSHFPALSIPYHPPLFPFLEAGLYALFGVRAATAYLGVFLMAALSAFLLYLLSLRASGSRLLALAVTFAFITLPVAQVVVSDIMIEFPATLFVLASMLCLQNRRAWSRLGPALAFAILASAAVWTKQTVFLGLVPWMAALFRRDWASLLRPPLWIASVLFGAACLALSALTRLASFSGQNTIWRQRTLSETVAGNTLYYLRSGAAELGILGIALLAIGLLWLVTGRAREDRDSDTATLLLAWCLAGALVPLFVRGYNIRYIIFIFPALILLGFLALYRWMARLWGRRIAGAAAVALSILISLSHLPKGPNSLTGPREAVARALERGPARILYLGHWPGQIVYAARELDPSLRSVVLRGDKLRPEQLQKQQLLAFVRGYGVGYLVVQFDPAARVDRTFTWLKDPDTQLDRIFDTPVRSGSIFTYLNGSIQVYRVRAGAVNPANDMDVRLGITGQTLHLTF